MRSRNPWVFLAMLSFAGVALAQTLDCPSATSPSRPCDAFHYHVLMYRPDTRGFVEASGVNQFASTTACERARAAAIRSNLAVVDYFKRVRNEQQYEPDRFGSCHCDMTIEPSSANFLSEAARAAQVRNAGEVRLRVREHLLDAGLLSDSELVRSLAPPPHTSLLGGSRLVPLPARPADAATENSVSELQSTKAGDSSKPVAAAADLPLVDVGGVPMPASAGRIVAATQEPVPVPEPDSDGAAEAFIAYETQRIQNVLKASSAIADETVKAKIFEACMQRVQLLSNLRRLIQGSGVRSRLGSELRTAKSESERQAFIARLFGNDIKPHWAPKDARDVIIEPVPEIDADPDRVLRDATGRFSIAQKKRALYVMLAQSQPTEAQQLWLTTLVDSYLR